MQVRSITKLSATLLFVAAALLPTLNTSKAQSTPQPAQCGTRSFLSTNDSGRLHFAFGSAGTGVDCCEARKSCNAQADEVYKLCRSETTHESTCLKAANSQFVRCMENEGCVGAQCGDFRMLLPCPASQQPPECQSGCCI